MVADAEAPGAPDSDQQKRRLRQEIGPRLGIDPRATEAEESFWREVGLRHQTADPKASAGDLVKLVLSKLGATSDEIADFTEEDGETPSVAAHEWLVSYLAEDRRPDEVTADEEEDEESGALAREQQILVSNQDHPIQTIFQFIEDGTYVLDPDWQRGYVWKPRQKRRFIESILLGLPIPPVLLFQDSRDKKMYVIDGRQRLETAYRFRLGSKKRKESFRTFSARQPGWRPDEKLHEAANKYFDKLPEDVQRHFNTRVIPARVFQNLPRRTLYEVFRRYNTGSEKLRPAEIRKAVYQGQPLHDMMFEVAGELGAEALTDPRERNVARELEAAMRNKKARYGAYNFVGRCLAFAQVTDELSVANAINKFMEDAAGEDPGRYRKEFVEAFEKAAEWYMDLDPLCVSDADSGRVSFHEWIATMQIVSTIKMLETIKAGRTTEDAVRAVIAKEWKPFVYGSWSDQVGGNVGGVLQEKQNTTTHWAKQREWIRRLNEGVGIREPPAPAPA